MGKDSLPTLPLDVEDFASDGKVEAMTTEAVGAYILLICKAWRESPPGSLPDDDLVLARWARLAPGDWSEVRSSVLAAFALGADGRYHQKRMRREYEKIVRVESAKTASAKRAASARWERTNMQAQCERNADALHPQRTQPEGAVCNSDTQLEDGFSLQKENSSKKKGSSFVKPTLDEVRAFCAENQYPIDAELFWNFYEANGWVQGRQGKPIRSWQHCVRTWVSNEEGKRNVNRNLNDRAAGPGQQYDPSKGLGAV